MNRRHFLQLSVLGITSVISRRLMASQGKTNVLFIAIDDLRGTVGCLCDKIAVTPNMDKLAAEGTVFLNAYCQQAVCNPSRASVITGMRPDTLKVWDLKTHFRKHHPDIVHFRNFSSSMAIIPGVSASSPRPWSTIDRSAELVGGTSLGPVL